ncbi:MAG: GW dipeptide domain-containing protein [Ignavibacteria bacterium]|nr:GW dipeptide domain-containing protein [Ignavibacteria bacterium]
MRIIIISFIFASTLALMIACGEKEQPENQNQVINQDSNISKQFRNVTVEEKLDASNYTYLKVNENGNSFWIAVPTMNVKPGEKISFSKFMEMKNFKSETLDRTFESVLFVEDAGKGKSGIDVASPHSNVSAGKDVSIKVEPLKDGYSVEQIYSKKSSLVNKVVKVKGVVVKVNKDIMGTNWIHIQDGTGKDGTHDLLVTSETVPEIGKTIIAEGKVISDKDFGSGYFYSVLLENSKIVIE